MNKVTFNRNNKKKKETETKNSLKFLKSHYYVYLTTATIHPSISFHLCNYCSHLHCRYSSVTNEPNAYLSIFFNLSNSGPLLLKFETWL